MKSKLHAHVLAMCSLAMLLAGCGAGGTTPETKNALHESTACISCHEDANWQTPGTGKSVVAEWKLSTHNTQNGAGCADCHDDGYMHPASCSKCHSVGTLAKNPTNNPDRDGKCANCHAKVNPRPAMIDGFNSFTYEDPNIPNVPAGSTTRFVHFSSGKRANYVSRFYRSNCRKCHNPHDTSSNKQQSQEWAQSGHGQTTTNPRVSYDFKTRGSSVPNSKNFGDGCVRCHTAAGPIKYITSGFSDVHAVPDTDANQTQTDYPNYILNSGTGKFTPTNYVYQDTTREVTACNVCHDDGKGYAYGYKVRTVGQVTEFYNYSVANGKNANNRISVSRTFDNAFASNICLVCHVGREIGANIQQADAQGIDFKNVGFISSHYLTAGASIFQTSGYEFNSRTYPNGGTFPHLHRTLGAGFQGPCVTCHMKPGRHTFLPVALDNNINRWLRQITGRVSSECAKCHDGATAPNQDVTSLNASKNGFFQVLEVLRLRMQSLGMYYRSGGIFSASTGSTRVTNWEKFGAGSGPGVMGAAFNYVLFNFDYGAYVHNSYYAKRLLYDSIDILDLDVDLNGNRLNYSTCTSIGPGGALQNSAAYQYLCTKGTTHDLNERP